MTEAENKELAETCIKLASTQKDALEIPYKQKENETCRLEILVRITSEDLDYIPIIQITSKDGILLLREEMIAYGRDAFICQFGSISLGKHTLRITPRKNYESEYYELQPISFKWE